MNNPVNDGEVVIGEHGKLKKILLPVSTALFVITLSIVIFAFRDKVTSLGNYGYLGVFLISLVLNSTVFFPLPVFVVIAAFGAAFNPVLVAIIAGAGGALGEITGYMAGASGRGVAPRNRMYIRATDWMIRWGSLTVFLFVLVPLLPLDMAAIAAGALRYPVWKFLLVCWFAKILLYLLSALAGAWGWEIILRFFG